MVDPQWPSPFIEPVAVEAWDAWFRWRDGTYVHDRAIEDTWQRVADALAAVESEPTRTRWRARFFECLARWQLLPDAVLLADAGTGRAAWPEHALRATVNAGVCVRSDAHAQRRLDFNAVTECAAVAVRAIDNAALVAGLAPTRLHVGLGGVADAFALLGFAYDSDDARTTAGRLARALAAGCAQASVELARDRGRLDTGACVRATRPVLNTAAPELLREIRRHGLRHAQLTATTSQRRVALLANDAADALDPLLGANHRHTLDAPGGARAVQSSGYALDVLLRVEPHLRVQPAALADVPWRSQIRMRAAVQPWMDAPIDYPLLLARTPTPDETAALPCEAIAHGLPVMGWRSAAVPP
jgi:ribonucleoside-diphosphate reductase alpha chain